VNTPRLENILQDYTTVEAFAAELGTCQPTVRRWISKYGLPAIRVGRRQLIHGPRARAWILEGRCAYQPKATGERLEREPADRAERIAAERRERAEAAA
jgi:excisionase family DNA binding protein